MPNAIQMLARVAAISFLGLSVACNDTRPEVNFDTDPQVLRGAWKVTIEDSNQVKTTEKLDVLAQYVDTSSYQLGGAVTLKGKTLSLAGTGKVAGKLTIRPQLTPVPTFFVSLKDADGNTWLLNSSTIGPVTKFVGSLREGQAQEK
jgi:hypothetical protein